MHKAALAVPCMSYKDRDKDRDRDKDKAARAGPNSTLSDHATGYQQE